MNFPFPSMSLIAPSSWTMAGVEGHHFHPVPPAPLLKCPGSAMSWFRAGCFCFFFSVAKWPVIWNLKRVVNLESSWVRNTHMDIVLIYHLRDLEGISYIQFTFIRLQIMVIYRYGLIPIVHYCFSLEPWKRTRLWLMIYCHTIWIM
jgi:hypothetical protein